MRDPAVAELLLEREAKGLQVPAVARSLFATFGAISALDGIPSVSTVITLVGVSVGAIVINVAFIWLLIRRRFVGVIGWLGAAIDALIVSMYPLISSAVLASNGLHWAYGLKGLTAIVYIILITINGLALRPAYPTIVGTAGTLTFLVTAVIASNDSAIVWADAPSFVGPEISDTAVATQVIFLAMTTAITFFLTRAARGAVIEATERAAERARLERAHASSVMEGRLEGLRDLVASLCHEMNTPLGALKSAVQTIKSAAEKGRRPDVTPQQTAKMLGLIVDTTEAPVQAIERLSGLVQRLNTFAALDSGDGDAVDVNAAVDRTLSLVPPSLVGDTEIVRDYRAARRVQVSAPRLNLALLTIVTNAFEAVKGTGQVTLHTVDDESSVRIVVEDNGPGMTADTAASLFRFRFERTGARVKAGLGLPAAFSLMKKHGGNIEVSSSEGRGATFTISLPLPE